MIGTVPFGIRNLTERTLRLPINLRLVEGSDSESLRKLTGSKFMPVILSEVGRIIKKEYPDFKLPPMPPIPYMDFTDSEMRKFSEIETSQWCPEMSSGTWFSIFCCCSVAKPCLDSTTPWTAEHWAALSSRVSSNSCALSQ